MVIKTWKVSQDGERFIVESEKGKERHNTNEGAQKSAERKLKATCAAWERYGWRVVRTGVERKGDGEHYMIEGDPPDKTKIATTYRLRIQHKERIAEEAKRLGCDEIDVIENALDLYFNGQSHEPN